MSFARTVGECRQAQRDRGFRVLSPPSSFSLEDCLAPFRLFCVFISCHEVDFLTAIRAQPRTPQTRRNPMENFLFIGGHQDGLNIPLADDVESLQMADGATGRETYIRDTLALGALA